MKNVFANNKSNYDDILKHKLIKCASKAYRLELTVRNTYSCKFDVLIIKVISSATLEKGTKVTIGPLGLEGECKLS